MSFSQSNIVINLLSRAPLGVGGSDLIAQVEQHATYEAALGIVLALMSTPRLRDVALRYVCHTWPSERDKRGQH